MNYIAIYMNYMVWRYETTYSRTSTSVWIALDRTPSLTGPVDCRVVGCGCCLLTTGRLSRGGWVVGGRSPTMITMLLCSPCLETIPMHSDLKPPAWETIIILPSLDLTKLSLHGTLKTLLNHSKPKNLHCCLKHLSNKLGDTKQKGTNDEQLLEGTGSKHKSRGTTWNIANKQYEYIVWQ